MSTSKNTAGAKIQRAAPTNIQTQAFTDRGTNPRRPINEDRYYVNEAAKVFVVADGMGGHADGEVAAQLAVDLIAASVVQANEQGLAIDSAVLLGFVELANEVVYREAASRGTNMGTTVVVAALTAHPTDPTGTLVRVAHAGDSRVYLSRASGLHQLTQDHAVDLGLLVREFKLKLHRDPNPQERDGLRRRVGDLTEALGTNEVIYPTLDSFALEPGDKILLCTDGLYKAMSAQTLAQILHDHNDDVAEALTREALLWGRDNFTGIVVTVVS